MSDLYIIKMKNVITYQSNFHFDEFDTDIDVDELLTIDFNNIYGEIATTSVILNRIGQLKANIDSEVRKQSFDIQCFEAELKNTIRSKIARSGGDQDSYAGSQQLSRDLMTDHSWRLKNKTLNNLKGVQSQIEQLYWAVKSKDDKLNNISRSLIDKNFEPELIQKSIDKFFATIRVNQ